MSEKIVIALGGNALITTKDKGSYQDQLKNVNLTTQALATLVANGYQLVVTHGNGPQVGNLLIQHSAAKDMVPALPMDVCGAQSQGQIGYLLQQSLRSQLLKLGISKSVVTLITQVEVDQDDEAFSNPSKPVGPFYGEKEVSVVKQPGQIFIEDAGRGYRRVVASPQPKQIVEMDAIEQFIASGSIVIACGGGGVPVVKNGHDYVGVEAVIDKDLASECLATNLKVDKLVILTDVANVAINYNKPNQEKLGELSVTQAKEYRDQGHFATGSMLPKVEAGIRFVSSGGTEAIITNAENIVASLQKLAGTRIVSN